MSLLISNNFLLILCLCVLRHLHGYYKHSVLARAMTLDLGHLLCSQYATMVLSNYQFSIVEIETMYTLYSNEKMV